MMKDLKVCKGLGFSSRSTHPEVQELKLRHGRQIEQ